MDKQILRDATGRRIGEIEIRSDLNERSRSYLIKSIRLGDERANTHDLIAILYEKSGDTVSALKHLNRAIELNLTVKRLHEKARILIDRNDISAAKETFVQARSLSSDSVNILISEGIIWIQEGKYSEAEKALQIINKKLDLMADYVLAGTGVPNSLELADIQSE